MNARGLNSNLSLNMKYYVFPTYANCENAALLLFTPFLSSEKVVNDNPFYSHFRIDPICNLSCMLEASVFCKTWLKIKPGNWLQTSLLICVFKFL